MPAAPPPRPRHALGFLDLNSYLVAHCHDEASLAQLAGELHTTIDVIRSRIDEAGICRSPLEQYGHLQCRL